MENKTAKINACVTPTIYKEFDKLRDATKQLYPDVPQRLRFYSNSGFATFLLIWALKNFDPSVNQDIQIVNNNTQKGSAK